MYENLTLNLDMNFILHIGTHKTGSTALQSFLFANRQQLLAQGVLYPITGLANNAHHTVAWTVKADNVEKTTALFSEIEKEAASSGVENILLSSEEFEFIRNPYKLQRFFLHRPKIKVVLFIRRPDFYLESEYNQHVKMYELRYKYDIYRLYYDIDFTQQFNYRRLCTTWESFSEIKVINYNHCSIDKLGIFKAFLANINVDWEDGFLIPDPTESNYSLSNLGAIYLARMNRVELSFAQHQNAISLIAEKFSSVPNRPLLSHQDRLVLWQRFNGFTEAVVKNYNVQPFVEPSEKEALNPQPIDFNDDFNKLIFDELLSQVKNQV
jgi:hypothetical protein